MGKYRNVIVGIVSIACKAGASRMGAQVFQLVKFWRVKWLEYTWIIWFMAPNVDGENNNRKWSTRQIRFTCSVFFPDLSSFSYGRTGYIPCRRNTIPPNLSWCQLAGISKATWGTQRCISYLRRAFRSVRSWSPLDPEFGSKVRFNICR